MKTIALLISVMMLLCSSSIAEVVLRQNGDVLSVKNDCYQRSSSNCVIGLLVT